MNEIEMNIAVSDTKKYQNNEMGGFIIINLNKLE